MDTKPIQIGVDRCSIAMSHSYMLFPDTYASSETTVSPFIITERYLSKSPSEGLGPTTIEESTNLDSNLTCDFGRSLRIDELKEIYTIQEPVWADCSGNDSRDRIKIKVMYIWSRC